MKLSTLSGRILNACDHNMPMTGEVIVNYYSEDMLSANFRVFNIYGGRYLQDTVFNDVVYTTEKSINVQWLK